MRGCKVAGAEALGRLGAGALAGSGVGGLAIAAAKARAEPYLREARNSRSVSVTASGFSSWTKWPAPGTSMKR